LTVGFFKGRIEVHNSLSIAPSLVGGGRGEAILLRLPVKSPELVSVFIEPSRPVKSIFPNNKDAKFKNHRRLNRKY
jgi:hypothetical protein